MNKVYILASIAAVVLAFGAGIAADHFYSANQYIDYVKLNHTKSGIFIIQDKIIYTVSELETDLVPDGQLIPSGHPKH